MVDELDTMSEGVEPHMGGPAGVSSNSPLLSVRNICGNQQNNGQNNDQNDTENFEDQVNRTLWEDLTSKIMMVLMDLSLIA